MSQKVRRPKVKVPGYVKVMAMLSPKRDGKTDRSYIKSMCSAVDSYNRHKNAAMKKIVKDTSDVE
jgi:hypothetical protein